jgi:Asp-tRNA(Asn)/Glu-tRNA(Gln) amidotransferase B subunit
MIADDANIRTQLA